MEDGSEAGLAGCGTEGSRAVSVARLGQGPVQGRGAPPSAFTPGVLAAWPRIGMVAKEAEKRAGCFRDQTHPR